MANLFSPLDRPWLNLGLFVATIGTTFGSYFFIFGGGVQGAALFSGSTLLILGAHEMGHYLLARHHRVDSSLPYFIPVPPPIGIFGTLGAVIRLRSRIPSRNALVDIGAAGPLAGLLIAVPLLVTGMSLSHVGDAPPMPSMFPGPTSLWVLLPELWHWAVAKWLGQHLPATPEGPGLVFGDNLLIIGLQRLVWGELPPGKELFAHPVFVAAWLGLLVTMLNLVPVGQLDGGHLTHAWLGRYAVPVGKALAVAMAGLAVFCSVSWVVWLLLTSRLVGFRHPEVERPDEPLSVGRKVVCVVCFVFFALTLMPIPMTTGGP